MDDPVVSQSGACHNEIVAGAATPEPALGLQERLNLGVIESLKRQIDLSLKEAVRQAEAATPPASLEVFLAEANDSQAPWAVAARLHAVMEQAADALGMSTSEYEIFPRLFDGSLEDT